MGANLEPGGALANRRARRRSRLPMSEINVTPMVDVMLVLLIIFMVTAPLLTVGVDIDAGSPQVELPGTEAGPVSSEPPPLNITVDADGKIYLDGAEIAFDQLMPRLAVFRDASGGTQVWVRGDQTAFYGDIAKVLVKIREAGLPVTLITAPPAPR
jgi:biopolymer transport protein TolR